MAMAAPPLAAHAAAAIAAAARSAATTSSSTVALQLPDLLLPAAPSIAALLRPLIPSSLDIVILADTTFGSCCVDSVAAEHANAALIVHFGPSCLSRPTASCPVLYVFEEAPLLPTLPALVDMFTAELGHDRSQPVLMLCDVMYLHAMDSLAATLADKGFTGIIWPDVPTLFNMPASSVANLTSLNGVVSADALDALQTANQNQGLIFREAQGRRYALPQGTNIQDLTLFFVGGESLTLTNIMMTHTACKRVLAFDPATGVGRAETGRVNRLLARRYYLVQRARDADVVGIVVGTLGLASYMPVIESLKRLVLAHGKKPYLLALGKPSPAKLGNFLEIDVFVLVACPENALLDTRDFLKPVVTPHELMVALGGASDWDPSAYELDLVSVDQKLQAEAGCAIERAATHARRHDPDGCSDGDSGDDDDPDAPHFSLVTGTFKQRKVYASLSTSQDTSDIQPGAIALRNSDSTLVQFSAASAAAEYLNDQRVFRGLEARVGEDESATVQEGRRGIARGYDNS